MRELPAYIRDSIRRAIGTAVSLWFWAHRCEIGENPTRLQCWFYAQDIGVDREVFGKRRLVVTVELEDVA